MKKATIGWILIIIGVLLLAFLFRPKATAAPVTSVPVDNSVSQSDSAGPFIVIGNTTIHVEVEDTDAGREQGLSGRGGLAPDSGMLFVFDEPQIPGFWMKDMKFPLDMVWITASSTIEGVAKNISPSTYPSVFAPKSPVKYVLEVPAGYFDAHEFKVGMPVRQELGN